MSYARNLLSRGEEIVFETRQHWFAVLARVWVCAEQHHQGCNLAEAGPLPAG